MEGPGIEFSEAVIDNGKFGKHTVRFEAGVLAQQADGAAAVYLDGDGPHGDRPRFRALDRRRG